MSAATPPVSVLDRIRLLQDAGADKTPPYATALAEISSGGKKTHWIWYIWPTLAGVRRTMRPDLELASLADAQAYLRDAALGSRLTEITAAATAQMTEKGVSPATLFGAMHAYDAPKFHEACTLFLLAAEKEGMVEAAAVFKAGLAAIAGGSMNARVLEVVGKPAS
jgi:uncharacterized protein (DUF1810 family)